jgi:Tol biopolymer transport system component/DNA-binding winged helix-turn-helix (wHTH) protein
MDQKAKALYEFGPFRLDSHERLLFRHGQQVPLTPKALDILLALVESSGHVLTKEELLRKVWADSFVEEGNLNRHISTLRKALGDDLEQPKYIETIPKRGYRFIASVNEIQQTAQFKEQSQALTDQSVEQTTTSSHNVPSAERREEAKRSWSTWPDWKLWALVSTGSAVLLFLGLTFIWRSPSPRPQRVLSRLTFDPGLQSEPTWSPDGRFIAYSSDRGGNFDIWVQSVGGGNPVQVTHSPAHDWQPDWSPNGKSIIFRSERDGGGLYIVPPLGGYERKISSFGYRPRWSPDSSRILFVSSALQGGGVRYEVYICTPDGAQPQRVWAEFLSRFLTVESIAWHPDGQRISLWATFWMVSLQTVSREFWTVPLAGAPPLKSEVTTTVNQQLQQAAVEFTRFQWAPSGLELYFEGLSRGVRNLWKVTVDPKKLSWIAGPERLTTGLGTDADVAISPDGKKMAFSSRSENTRIWSLPFDARLGQVKGDGQPLTPTGMDASAPELSRDGKKLAFFVTRPGTENRREELWTKSLENGRETMLEADDCMRSSPRWSRDGMHLAYRRCRVNPKDARVESLMMQVLARGGEEQVISSVNTVAYDWSNDDRWLVVSRLKTFSGPTAMCLCPISAAPYAERELRVLASDPKYNFWQMRFSPDERWICFNATSQPSGFPSVIGVLPSSGGPWAQVTEDQWADKPRWSPDGKIIYFLSNRKTSFFNVYGIHFDPSTGKPNGEIFQVTRYESPSFMVSPDVSVMEFSLGETRLVLPIMQVAGSIWMLDNVDR